MSRLRLFYLKHGQKTIATILGGAALVDFTGYHDSIAAFVGERGYAGIRLIGAAAVLWRAIQATSTTNAIVTQSLTAAGVPPK